MRRALLLACLLLSGCLSDASAGFRFGGAGGDDLAEWENVCTIDFGAVPSAAWTDAGGPFSLRCDSGSNSSPFDWTVHDSANSTVFGPDGSSGVDINPTTGTLWWSGNDDAPSFRATLDDVTGGTASRDDVWMFTVEFGGDALASNFEAFGIGVVDAGNDGWVNRVRYVGADKWNIGRFLAGSITQTDLAVASIDTLQIVMYGDRAARFGYGTAGLPTAGTLLTQVDATKDGGTMQAANPGTTVAKLDPATAVFRIFVEEQNAGGSYSKIAQKLRVERATP